MIPTDRGGIDPSRLGRLLTRTALCADCIGRKTGTERGNVDESLERLRPLLMVIADVGRCDLCQDRHIVYRLG